LFDGSLVDLAASACGTHLSGRDMPKAKIDFLGTFVALDAGEPLWRNRPCGLRFAQINF